jgi:DDE domain
VRQNSVSGKGHFCQWQVSSRKRSQRELCYQSGPIRIKRKVGWLGAQHEVVLVQTVETLNSRDLVQMMAERGITLSHTTILRWVQEYVPEFEKRWNHYARPVGDSWRVDETYVKVKGQWVYLYPRRR